MKSAASCDTQCELQTASIIGTLNAHCGRGLIIRGRARLRVVIDKLTPVAPLLATHGALGLPTERDRLAGRLLRGLKSTDNLSAGSLMRWSSATHRGSVGIAAPVRLDRPTPLCWRSIDAGLAGFAALSAEASTRLYDLSSGATTR